MEANRTYSDINDYLKSLLMDPMLWRRLTEDGLDDKIVGEEPVRKVVLLCAMGSKVINAKMTSYNLLINSAPGAGKDHTADNVLKSLPKGMVEKQTRISPTVFNYWKSRSPNWSWDGKVVYLEDISNSVLNSEVFKVMCSSGSKAVIVINQVAVELEVKGKPVIIVTSASASPSAEMVRRFLVVSCDETEKQTRDIMDRCVDLAITGKTSTEINNYHNALQFLNRVNVKLPDKIKLAVNHFPSKSLHMRTHFPRFLDLIKASCAVHQFQREKECDDTFIAQGEDFDIAREIILSTTTNSNMIPLTKDQRNVLDILKELPVKVNCEHGVEVESGYSLSELEPRIKFCGERQLRRYLDRLVELGFVIKKSEDRDNSRKAVMTFKASEQVDDIKIPRWHELN